MPCRTHEIFFSTCGHVFRYEEPANPPIDRTSYCRYPDWDPRSKAPSQAPHTSLHAHPCNKHLPRTISLADRSPIGSWRLCPSCEAGPKLPEYFKLQDFSCRGNYGEGEWKGVLGELRAYYRGELNAEMQVEWCCEGAYGRDWEVDKEAGCYGWERNEGVEKSCRVRSAEQELRENKFSG